MDPTGSLNTARTWHTATLLPDGRVLVAGSWDEFASDHQVIASAELCDPVSGTWSLAAPMSEARGGHTATLLLDGRVLVTGGDIDDGPGSAASAEIYDPATGTLTLTVRVAITARGTVSNTAWITAAELDPDTANNTASAAVQVASFYRIYLPLLLRSGE
jgi:hypothetical protein